MPSSGSFLAQVIMARVLELTWVLQVMSVYWTVVTVLESQAENFTPPSLPSSRTLPKQASGAYQAKVPLYGVDWQFLVVS